MYLWKCWRDTRSTFLVILGAILVVGAFAGYVRLDPFGWIGGTPPLNRLPDALHKRAIWETTAESMVATTLGAIALAGFVVGALGVGMEFEKGTADFLLTRPRSRRYLLWTSWSLGAAQMVALVLMSLMLQFLGTTVPYRIESLDDAGRHLAGFGTMALVLYSVTYLMTTLARNSRNGTGLGVLAITAYSGVFAWLKLWYGVHIPFFGELISRSFRASPSFAPAVAGWLAVCLTLVLIAQWRFQRAEV